MSESAGIAPHHDRVLVFTATYDERDNISEFCDRVFSLERDYDLMIVDIVDDNSPDGTGDILDDLAENEPRLTVVHRPRKLGLGSAHKLAITYAAKRGYDVLVTLDADLSHDPSSIAGMIEALGRADFVIGSRYMPGGTSNYTGYRKLASVLANRSARLLLGVPLHEVTTSFRVFRVSMFRAFDFARISSQGYSFFMESVWYIHRAGFRCAEVPIRFVDRLHGQSKIPKNEIFRGMRKLIQLWLKRFARWHPARSSVPVDSKCYLCASDLLIERYPKRGEASRNVATFQCTSADHWAKPQVIECLVCGLVAAGEQGDVRDLGEVYADVVDETYVRDRDVREKTFAAAFDGIAPFLPATGRMLEIGAYCGIFLEVAKARGWEAEGVEPSKWAVSYAQERDLSVRQGTLEDVADELDGGYDAVVMWDVLEHLADPIASLVQMRKLVRENGTVCLSTLDIDSWFPRLLGRNWPWIVPMHH